MRVLISLTTFLVILLSVATVYCGQALAAPVPLLKIDEPTDGAVIESYVVNLNFSLKNFTLKDYKSALKNNPNQGHLHIWLDKDEKTAETAVKYFKDSPYTFADVLPGKHTMVVELVNNDHTNFDPQIVQTIKFETKAPAGSEAAPTKPEDSPKVSKTTTGEAPSQTNLVGDFSKYINYYTLGIGALVLGLVGLLVLKR